MNPFTRKLGPRGSRIETERLQLTGRRLTSNQKLNLLLLGVVVVTWTLMGVPNFVDFLMGREVYPQWPFDFWWMWLM